MKDNDKVYWLHLNDSVKDILKYTTQGKDEFFKNKMMQDACLRQLQIIGEAVKKLGDTEKARFPKIAWKQIAGMRDKVIHDYFEVDLNLVWDVIEKHLPTLQTVIKEALKTKQ